MFEIARRTLKAIAAALMIASPAFAGTITGTMISQNGAPIQNGTIGFTLAQAGLAIGTGSVVPITTACYTANDGTVVGIANPLLAPRVSTSTSGALPAGNYYAQLSAYAVDGHETLVGPEVVISLPTGGAFTLTYLDPYPLGYTQGVKAYVGTSSGSETLQGTTSGGIAYTQNAALTSGAAEPTSNSTVCSIAFNDTIIPYSGYKVSLTSRTGDAFPGFPQQWQLNGGLNGTVNISQGAPLWNGLIIYPQPIMAQPLNHGPQSISGPLGMSGYDIFGVGALGIGTNTPSYPLDVENGFANFADGILLNGNGGTVGQCVASDGTAGRTWVNCLTSLGTINYQSVHNPPGTALPGEGILTFTADFACTDNAGVSTECGLHPTTVTAGTYTNPTVTFDANGRATSASSGTPLALTRAIHVTTQCSGSNGDCICTSSSGSYDECSVNLSFSAADSYPTAAFPNSFDAATCNATPSPINDGASNNGSVNCFVVSGNAAGVTVMLQNLAGRPSTVTDIWVTALGH